ncbi:MAG: hydrogenase expression/formation protein HypE [Fervidicoccaceae archaeon]
MSSRVIRMEHGAGGAAMHELIREVVVKRLGGSGADIPLEELDDAGAYNGVVISTDSYTVKPIIFPGGDIGRLAVAGTVNDVLMVGGEPKALALAMVLEEGLPLEVLERILESASSTAREAGVWVITGDTKVVERGALDGVVLTTTGIGFRHRLLDHNFEVLARVGREMRSRWLLDRNIRPGDKLILTGHVGDHAIALLSAREGLKFEAPVKSDVAPLTRLVEKAFEAGGVVAMQDPTRGGLASLLNEWSEKTGLGIIIEEEEIPIRDEVRSACEYLGLDPLELGNEGKAVLAVAPQLAEAVLQAVRETPEGRHAEIIGEVTDRYEAVVMRTAIGGLRVVPPPIGDPVPRIC